MSYNVSRTMSNAMTDPLSNLPDPVVFYDEEGRKTGWMKKAEIREKGLVILYNPYGPEEAVTQQEAKARENELDKEYGCPRRIADLKRKAGIPSLAAISPRSSLFKQR